MQDEPAIASQSASSRRADVRMPAWAPMRPLIPMTYHILIRTVDFSQHLCICCIIPLMLMMYTARPNQGCLLIYLGIPC